MKGMSAPPTFERNALESERMGRNEYSLLVIPFLLTKLPNWEIERIFLKNPFQAIPFLSPLPNEG